MPLNCCSRATAGRHSLELCRQLRYLQLYVQLLNMVNQDLIFTWKLLSLGMCIVNGYAAISHFGGYPIFGVMLLRSVLG